MDLPTKVIVITGGTSGIGLSLLERLLLDTRSKLVLRICILCRNMEKGRFVRSTLSQSHRSAEIELVQMDTADVKSVLQAAKTLLDLYERIDYLYLNAGILPIKGLDITALISSDIMSRLRTGEHILKQENSPNKYGVPNVFATNVLGHFVLYQELQPVLTSGDGDVCSHVIWTTSNNAVERSFSMDDITCASGTMPYGSSKYVINALSVHINNTKNSIGCYSSLAEPGLCVTGMNGNFLPGWLWSLVIFLFTLLRVVLNHMTLSTYNGSESLVWLFNQNPRKLNKRSQYESAVNVYNRAYVRKCVLGIEPAEAQLVYDKMEEISGNIRERLNET